MKLGGNQLRQLARQGTLWLKIAVLVFAGIAPALVTDRASAAQLTPRTLTLGTSQSNTETTHDFTFEMPSLTPVQSIILQYCQAPLGTCVLPPSMDIFTDTTVGQDGFTQTTNPFALYTDSTDQGDCTDNDSATSTQVCLTRDEDGDEPANTEFEINLGDILNPTASGVSLTFYVRITLYSDEAFTTEVHQGTVAGAIVNQLVSVGRVAERLIFCVGAIEDDAALPSSCDDQITPFPTQTGIDLGIIDNTSVTATPVEPTISNANLSDDRYGLLIVNTNASGGVTVSYFPEALTGSEVVASDTDQLRAFRVIPTDCSSTAASETDQCFVSAGTAALNPIEDGVEEFGMAVACVHPKSGTSTTNFISNGGSIGAAYQGDGDFTDDVSGFEDDCENETVSDSYYWGFDDDPSDGIGTLASSTTVVDDEAIKIRFGASAASTTPTGTYQVTTTYIATATF